MDEFKNVSSGYSKRTEYDRLRIMKAEEKTAILEEALRQALAQLKEALEQLKKVQGDWQESQDELQRVRGDLKHSQEQLQKAEARIAE
jgi:peptidoglycan hydrolase CwlO-like protein